MEKSFNLKVMDFKKSLSGFIDNSGLPAIVLQMVLKEFTQEVSTQTQQIIRKEIQDYENNIKNKKETTE